MAYVATNITLGYLTIVLAFENEAQLETMITTTGNSNYILISFILQVAQRLKMKIKWSCWTAGKAYQLWKKLLLK